MLRKFGRTTSSNQIGATEAIIAICVVMAVVTFVAPYLTSALLFFPPLGFAQPYRFLTAAFLHSGLTHLLFNMLTLYFLGQQLERGLGRWRFVALYLASALAGNVAVALWAAFVGPWNVGVVGASGAVFGLFGALLALTGKQSASHRSILVLVLINLVYGFLVPGVAWQAHVGGLVAGLVLAAMWKFAATHTRPSTVRAPKKRAAADILSLIVVLAALVGLAFVVYAI